MDLTLVRSASAAQVFYRTFSSAGLVGAMIDILREGMVAIDIGAHVGEYTMVAAMLVGSRGMVYAFEPQETLAEVIKLNAARNNLRNVSVWNQAVADHAGPVRFLADGRSMGGWIARNSQATMTVPGTTLDDFAARHDIPRINFIKIDAGGNELAVLQGGKALFNDQQPAIICKFYHPEVVKERFGYDARMIIECGTQYHYKLFLLDDAGQPDALPIWSMNQIAERFDRGAYCLNLLGVRGN